jgi:predicted  nucleic acid-binding Zn-ribbon protein
MDGFFRRLQEVADLPNQVASSGRRGEDSSGGATDPTEAMSREDLVDALGAARQRAAAAEETAANLRREASEINDQYAAFKVKVNTWREQMKAARTQDRKTIETLRAAAGGAPGDDGADHTAKKATVDATYAASLEEQVSVLKETVRRHAAERDEVQLELERLKARSKKEMQEAADAAVRAADDAKVHPGAGAGGAGATVAASLLEDAQSGLRRYASLVQQMEEDAELLKQKLHSQERANEILTQDLDNANSALAKAVADHAYQLRDAQSDAQRTTSARYAKDLEAELQAYRRQLADVQQQLLDSHAELADLRAGRVAGTPPPSGAVQNSDVPAGTAPPFKPQSPVVSSTTAMMADPSMSGLATQRRLQLRVEEVEHELATKTRELRAAREEAERLELNMREVEAEGSIREDTLNSVFAENKVLRERVDALRSDLDRDASSIAQLERAIHDREAAVADTNARVEEMAKALDTAQKQVTKLQRELSEKADAVRQLKLAELQRQTDDRVRLQVNGHAARTHAAGGPSPATPGAEAIASRSALDGAAAEAMLSARLHSLKVPSRYHRFITPAHHVWTNARIRNYVIAAAVLLLLLMFMYTQSTAIEEDAATVELLRHCKEMLKGKATPGP